MKTITLKGLERESVGKSSTKVLRNAGLVPCVVYGGGGNAPIHFSVKANDLNQLVYTSSVYIVEIDLGKNKISAIIQDLQFYPVTDKILHIDFYQIYEDKKVTMDIPVKIIGNSKGVMIGGSLRTNVRKLRISSLPKNLPDFVEVDISHLDIGNKLYVSELTDEKFEILNPNNTVIVQVKMSRTASKQDDVEETETTETSSEE